MKKSPRRWNAWRRKWNQHYADLEALEQRLTVLEEKMIATARTRQSEERMLAARRELDRQLRPYRGKMTADQLAMLEKRYLERDLLEEVGPAAIEPVLHAVSGHVGQTIEFRGLSCLAEPPWSSPADTSPTGFQRRPLSWGRLTDDKNRSSVPQR